jgi:hypothetical protein
MKSIASSSRLIDDSGGSMVFTVPLNKPKEIAPLFNLIDTNDEEELKLDSDFPIIKSKIKVQRCQNSKIWYQTVESLIQLSKKCS